MISFVLTGTCVKKRSGEGVPSLRKKWGLPKSWSYEEHVLLAHADIDQKTAAVMG